MYGDRRQQGRAQGPVQPGRRDLRRRAATSRPPATRTTCARAIFAYNHADWYVDSVLLRARLIAGVPADLIGSLTGLTEGRFPVYARARYADDLAEAELLKRVKHGQNAANVDRVDRRPPLDRHLRRAGLPGGRRQRRRDQEDRRTATARPLRHAPGRLRQPLHLRAPRLGRRSTTPCPRQDAADPERSARAVKANGDDAATRSRPRPRRPGRQPEADDRRRAAAASRPSRASRAGERAGQGAPVRPPGHARARARPAASTSCSTPRRASRAATRPTATTSRARSGSTRARSRCAACSKGSRVIGGTIIGRVGRTDAGQGAAPRLLDPPGRPRRAADRPEADPRRLEAARGDRDLPRLGQATCCTATTRTACRSARSCCCPSRSSRSACSPTSASRSTRAAATTSAPARSTAACSPRSSTWPSPACGRRSPASSAATASTRARATSPSTAPATRSTSPRSTASRSSATRSRAGSPSRPCAG